MLSDVQREELRNSISESEHVHASLVFVEWDGQVYIKSALAGIITEELTFLSYRG